MCCLSHDHTSTLQTNHMTVINSKPSLIHARGVGALNACNTAAHNPTLKHGGGGGGGVTSHTDPTTT